MNKHLETIGEDDVRPEEEYEVKIARLKGEVTAVSGVANIVTFLSVSIALASLLVASSDTGAPLVQLLITCGIIAVALVAALLISVRKYGIDPTVDKVVALHIHDMRQAGREPYTPTTADPKAVNPDSAAQTNSTPARSED